MTKTKGGRLVKIAAVAVPILVAIFILGFFAKDYIGRSSVKAFEKEVIPAYTMELRKAGFGDLTMEAVHKNQKGKGITYLRPHQQVEPLYKSEEVDSFYKDDKVNPELLTKMDAMRQVQNQQKRRYEYKRGPFRDSVDLNLGYPYETHSDRYRNYFRVDSKNHKYVYEKSQGQVVLTVDDITVYTHRDNEPQAKGGSAANQRCPSVKRSRSDGKTTLTAEEMKEKQWPYIQWDYPDEIHEGVTAIYGQDPDTKEINPFVVEQWLEDHES